jgi:hypothetical protein
MTPFNLRPDATGEVFAKLRPGDRVEVEHEVKVGFRRWRTTTAGEVLRLERRRHGLHERRASDDKVYSDLLVLKKPDGELTTVTLDEFSELRRV